MKCSKRNVDAFLEAKSGQAVLLPFLGAAPDVEPMPGDEVSG